LPETISTAAPTNYAVDIATFSLTIVGAVSTPLDLSYAQIQAYPPVTQTAEIICPDTEDEFDDWTGVPLSTLLKAAGLTAGAAEVVFTGVDGYHIQLPLETVLNDGVFLAYQMNGKTLTQDRGYPLRLVVIGWLGNYWMRWVTKIEVKSVLSTFNRNPAVIKQLSVSAVAAGIKLCPCKVAGGVSAKNM
jgi:DMSO/TMAO reductase YedYZ molybdopterin-dependent catalytic subunit